MSSNDPVRPVPDAIATSLHRRVLAPVEEASRAIRAAPGKFLPEIQIRSMMNRRGYSAMAASSSFCSAAALSVPAGPCGMASSALGAIVAGRRVWASSAGGCERVDHQARTMQGCPWPARLYVPSQMRRLTLDVATRVARMDRAEPQTRKPRYDDPRLALASAKTLALRMSVGLAGPNFLRQDCPACTKGLPRRSQA